MWCAVHVRGGSEARAKALVTGLFSKGLSVRCFHLRRIRRKKAGSGEPYKRTFCRDMYFWIRISQAGCIRN